jgi:hypothetical protein
MVSISSTNNENDGTIVYDASQSFYSGVPEFHIFFGEPSGLAYALLAEVS